jgi:hypothetical protein
MSAFAVVFSRMRFRICCPKIQVSLPKVYDETAEQTNGLTVLQLLLKINDCVIRGRKIWADQQSSD